MRISVQWRVLRKKAGMLHLHANEIGDTKHGVYTHTYVHREVPLLTTPIISRIRSSPFNYDLIRQINSLSLYHLALFIALNANVVCVCVYGEGTCARVCVCVCRCRCVYVCVVQSC